MGARVGSRGGRGAHCSEDTEGVRCRVGAFGGGMRQRGQHRAQHVGRERRREDGFQSRGRQPSHVGAPLVVVFAKRSPGALHVGAAGWAREGGASRTERARGRGRGGWRGWRCLRRPIASVSLGRRCVGGDAEDKWVGVVVGVVLHREDLHPHRGFGTPRLGLFRSQGATLCHLPPRRGVLGLGLKSHLQVLQRLRGRRGCQAHSASRAISRPSIASGGVRRPSLKSQRLFTPESVHAKEHRAPHIQQAGARLYGPPPAFTSSYFAISTRACARRSRALT